MALSNHPMFSGDYMPHGMCFAWEPSILWTTIISDLLIASSYFSIPIAILLYFHKKPPQKYISLFLLFAAFIFLCGLTHLYSIHTLYKGYYGIHAIIKAFTAIVSFITAIAVFRYLPLALKIPSSAELMAEKAKSAENAIFKVVSDNSPVGLILVNDSFKIRHINAMAANIFGYEQNELIDQPISQLIDQNLHEKHSYLMSQYIQSPKDSYSMNSGRIVDGIQKDGQTISIEIGLSTGEYQGEKLVFASVVNCEEKVQSADILRQTLMKLDRIIETTEDGLWEWNVKTNSVWQSPKHLTMMGAREDDESSFELWEAHIHPDHRDRVLEEVNKSVAERSDYYVEYLGKAESGEYEWFRSKGRLSMLNGEPYLLSGIISNIHKEITYGQSIQEKNNYLEKVINRSINGLYIYSFEQQMNTYINDEYTNITGYSLDDLKKIQQTENFLDLFHPDDVDEVLAHMKGVTESKEGSVHSLQYRFKHKNGNWIWCLSRDSVFSFNEAGDPSEMLGTFIDLTPIKRSELMQHKLMKDFQNTFEMAAVGVAHVALDGSWIKVNNKVCEILGYSRDELLKIDFQCITYPEDLNIDLTHVNQLIDGEADSYDMEKRYIRKTGEVIWANLTVSIVRLDDGTPDYFISVIEDIEHRKKIEADQKLLNEELRKSNDQLTRFAYSASHDMQEPLRKITSFSTSLLSRLDGNELDEQSRFELERISYASKRMKTMIDKLLELSRASNKKLILKPESCKAVVLEAQEQVSVALFESNAMLMIKGDEIIYCDRVVMTSVFENLINNCIKYRHPSRDLKVTITIEQHSDSYTSIRVCDNGLGFENKFSDEIFEPFKRLVANSEVEGTGMGLSICKQLVSLHGGTLLAYGTPGEGAEFTLVLPSKEAIIE